LPGGLYLQQIRGEDPAVAVRLGGLPEQKHSTLNIQHSTLNIEGGEVPWELNVGS
jgi:hypothetical protein